MLSQGERNAIRKANQLDGASLVQRVAHGLYRVPSLSEPGTVYTVTGTALDGSDHRCSCPAGQHGRPCWHAASVRLRRVQEEARRQLRQMQARKAITVVATTQPIAA